MSAVSIRENPEGVDESYLRCLQECFPGAWDRCSFAWFHRRKFRDRSPDLLTVYEGNRIVAGVCINFRQLQLPDDRLADIGILTAAWTLPGHRGRWHLARLIRAAQTLGARRGYDGLLAFVRARNASCAVLRRTGAAPVDSFYIHVEPTRCIGQEAVAPAPGRWADCQTEPKPPRRISFRYADATEWRSQFLDRPGGTTVTEAAGCSVISDADERASRVQFIDGPESRHMPAIAAMARATGTSDRNLFHFSTSSALARCAAHCGLNVERGHIMIFDLRNDTSRGSSSLLDADAYWSISPGDRM